MFLVLVGAASRDLRPANLRQSLPIFTSAMGRGNPLLQGKRSMRQRGESGERQPRISLCLAFALRIERGA